MLVTVGPEELGRQLRRARQQRGLSLRDVHAITAIPLPCLAALEEGDLAQLPSPVYARGYVRSYAEAVRLDGDRLALELWRTSPPKKAAARTPSPLAPLRQPASPFVPKEGRVRMPKPPKIMRPRAGRIMRKSGRRHGRGPRRFAKLVPALERTAIVILVLVLAAGLWGLLRDTSSDETKTATTASRADATPPATPSSTAPPPTTVPPPPAPPAADNGSQATYVLARPRFTVVVAATDAPLWVQVRAGQRGAVLFTGTLQPGDTKPFDAPGVLWVRVGNLGHSAVTIDGAALKLPAKPAAPYNLLIKT
jgi:hypothetical protein